MSQPLSRYNVDTHAPLRHPLLLTTPDTVPPVDELEMVQAELKALRQKSLERAKKADGDLKLIESAMKRMREQEKGKAKAFAKVKRESSHTPSLDQNDRSFSPSTAPLSANTPSTSSAPVLNIPSPAPKAIGEIRKPKKKDKDKKRKRDEESDGEHETPRPRKFSPHPPAIHKEQHHYKPSKLSNVSHPKTPSAQDWHLPSSTSLLPLRPPRTIVPPSGPRRPIEVKEDFSKAKAPTSQVQINTFYTSIEPWLRSIREEDVGWLEYTADEVEPFVVPPLGRHYTEHWEEEDISTYGGIPALLDFSSSRSAAVSSSVINGTLPKWDSSTVAESDVTTDKGLGPVTERLVSALLPAADQSTWKSLLQAEEEYESKLDAGLITNGVTLPKEKVFVAEFEERVKDTARFYGMLNGEPDFSQVVDDPISTALRQAQRQLREVVAINKARKRRLAAIAKERLAYQEYLDSRDALDKSITATFSKLQKKDGPKANKKKKKADMGPNGVNGAGGPPVPLPNPASVGLGPDDEDRLIVPESLKQLVETRRSWVDCFGQAFDIMAQDFPGRPYGLPDRSVFDGIEEEVRHELGRTDVLNARGDRMNGVSPASAGPSVDRSD